MIRQLVDEHDQAFPSVLEIPSKDHPYDPSKDSVLKSKINIDIIYIIDKYKYIEFKCNYSKLIKDI